jgi:hypothetical protein
VKNEKVKKIYTSLRDPLDGAFEFTDNFKEADLLVIDCFDDVGKLSSEKPILYLGKDSLDDDNVFLCCDCDLPERSQVIYCALNALDWVGSSVSAKSIRRLLFKGAKDKFLIVLGEQGAGKSFFCTLYALRPNNLVPVSFDFLKLKNVFNSQQLVNYVQTELSADFPFDSSKIYLVLMENFNALSDAETESVLDTVLKIAQKNPKLQALITSQEFSSKLEQIKYIESAKVVYIPPLRERLEDLLALIKSFNPEIKVSPEALEVMFAYNWPLNCLELKTLAKEKELTIENLADEMFDAKIKFSIEKGCLKFLGQTNILNLKLKRAFLASKGSFQRFCEFLKVSHRTGSFLARKFGFKFNAASGCF